MSDDLFMRQMTFDVETIPDTSRKELFDLPEPVSEIQTEDLVSPAEFVIGENGNVPEAKIKAKWDDLISETTRPNALWIDECIHTEATMGKARKGVLSFFESKKKEINQLKFARDNAIRAKSLDPFSCRIISIGWSMGNEEPTVLVTPTEQEERAALTRWWDQAEDAVRFCGYNILPFDTPVVFNRSRALEVKPTRRIGLNKYNGDCLDMLVHIGGKGKLKDLLRLTRNLGGTGVEEEIDGSMVFDMFLREEFREIGEYNGRDVVNEVAFYEYFRGYYWD